MAFDTASTYFCPDQSDEPLARDRRGQVTDGDEPVDKHAGFRTRGNFVNHRIDLSQVVTGVTGTREGIPLRI